MSKEYDEYAKKEYDRYERLARTGALPAYFDQWDLADKDGWAIAHAAAMFRALPDNYTQWELADNDGWTVAHAAAACGHLPDNFSQWGLADNDGLTVLRRLLSNVIKSDKYVTRWGRERPLCNTDADWEVFKVELPEIYQKYTISGHMLDVDGQEASQGALRGALL